MAASTFLDGALRPLRALGFIRRHRELWPSILWPLLLNVVVGVLLYGALLWAGLAQIDRISADPNGPLAALEWLLRAVLVVALLVVIGFLLVRFGVILGAPFYAQLAERIERIQGLTPAAVPPARLGPLTDIGRALGFELKKLLLVLPLAGLLLLGNLIPVAGQAVGIIGGVLLGALLACLDFFDPPLERRRLSFRQKLGVIRALLPGSLGFGWSALGWSASRWSTCWRCRSASQPGRCWC